MKVYGYILQTTLECWLWCGIFFTIRKHLNLTLILVRSILGAEMIFLRKILVVKKCTQLVNLGTKNRNIPVAKCICKASSNKCTKVYKCQSIFVILKNFVFNSLYLIHLNFVLNTCCKLSPIAEMLMSHTIRPVCNSE